MEKTNKNYLNTKNRNTMKKLFFITLILSGALAQAQINFKDYVSKNWERIDQQDNFGDPTGTFVYRTKAKGTFSNSATAGSKLAVDVAYSGGTNTICFLFWEYESRPANFINERITIKIKSLDGTITELLGYTQDNIIYLFDEEHEKAIELFSSGTGDYKIYLADKYGSDYLFKLTI